MAELHSTRNMDPPMGGVLSAEPVPDPPSASGAGPSSGQTSHSPTITNDPGAGGTARRRQYREFLPDPNPWPVRSQAYQWRPIRGMWHDVRRRAPFYVSDWTEAAKPRNWERTIAATIRIYFLK